VSKDVFEEKALELLGRMDIDRVLKEKHILLIGAGGAGTNIVRDMSKKGLKKMAGVEVLLVNSDIRMLERDKEEKNF